MFGKLIKKVDPISILFKLLVDADEQYNKERNNRKRNRRKRCG